VLFSIVSFSMVLPAMQVSPPSISSRISRVSRRGFTLFELLIVIVIAAVLMAIATPSFDPMISSMALDGAASELVSGLQLARSEAVRQNRPIAVKISDRTWTVYNDANGNTTPDVGEVVLREDTYTDRIQGQAVEWQVTFQPSGIVKLATVGAGASEVLLPTGICLQTQDNDRYRRMVWFETRASSPIIRVAGQVAFPAPVIAANCPHL
jgi:type II secretion system protein H